MGFVLYGVMFFIAPDRQIPFQQKAKGQVYAQVQIIHAEFTAHHPYGQPLQRYESVPK